MRKIIAAILLVILVTAVAVVVAAVMNEDFKNSVYTSIEGSVLMPVHDWTVTTWMNIGAGGFTYIAAATLAIAIIGSLFISFIIIGLVWKKGIQQGLLHRTPTQTTDWQARPSTTIPVTNDMQSRPTTQPEQPKETGQ